MQFEEIWKDYQANIKSFLHTKISNSADVDDLMQDILFKTYKSFNTLKSDSSVKSWLFQIANNTIIDFYRKKGQANEITADEFMIEEDSPDIQASLSQCIAPFIKSLPSDSADLLTAIDINGQSQKEYAAQNYISYSTLKSRVQKARQELRRQYEDCCSFSFDTFGNITDYEEKSDFCKKC